MKNQLLINAFNPISNEVLMVIGFYVFLFCTLVFIFFRFNSPSYFGSVLELLKPTPAQFNKIRPGEIVKKNNVIIQLCFLILLSFGLMNLIPGKITTYDAGVVFGKVLLFYSIQSAGIYLFSVIILGRKASFFTHRMSYNELFALVLFPCFFLLTFLPKDASVGFLALLCVSWVFAIVRSSIYLSRFISGFHIILYLCTLEIIPVLFLLKFIY